VVSSKALPHSRFGLRVFALSARPISFCVLTSCRRWFLWAEARILEKVFIYSDVPSFFVTKLYIRTFVCCCCDRHDPFPR